MNRLVISLLVLLTLGSSCSPEQAAAPDDKGEAIVESRQALGGPMLQMAEAVIALADGINEARHEVQRGREMTLAVEELQDRRTAVDDAVQAAREAAPRSRVERAEQIMLRAADVAERAAAAADDELEFLADAAKVDKQLLAAAAAWDEPGSQSEIRARLAAKADGLSRVRRRAQALRPQPPRCAVMKRNRLEWVTTVRQRTVELQANANSAGGSEFDRLRGAYRRLPLAVEPRSADGRDRQCWADTSAVARGADRMRRAVGTLREALTT